MKPSRIWQVLSLSVVVCLLAVACAPVSAPAGQAGQPGTPAQAQQPVSTANPASSKTGTVELVYWRTLTGPAGTAQDDLVKKFNDSQKGIHVSVEFQGDYTALANKLTASAAGGGLPDVTQLGTYEILQFARSGVLQDVKPLMDGPNGIDTKDWPGTLVQAGQVGSGLYWLPFNVSVPVLYYNTEAFKEAGLGGPPATWSEFYDDARKLTKKDDKGVVTRAGFALWNTEWPLLSLIWSEGGQLTSRDWTKITLNDPVVTQVMGQLQSLAKDGALTMPDSASGGHRAAFKNGQAAMILDSPAPFGDIFAGATGFTPMVANYPAGKDGKKYAPGGGGIAMIAKLPKEKQDAAWQFIKFMLSPDSLAYYAQKSGYVAFTGAAQAAAGEVLKDPRYAVIYQAVPNVVGDFSVNWSPAIRNNFNDAVAKIILQKADVKTTLDAADAKAEQDIQKEPFTRGQ